MAAAYEPPVSDAGGPLVIRPSWRALGRWEIRVVGFMAFGLVVGGLQMSRYGEGWVLAFIGIAALTLVGYAVYLAAYMNGTRITVTANAILVTHWFRSTAAVAPSAIVRVVKISVKASPKAPLARPEVFAFSADRHCVLSLYAERWGTTDLDRIWHHLGITPEGSWGRTILEDHLPVEFPGAF